MQSNKLQLAKVQLYPLGFNYSVQICDNRAKEVNTRKHLFLRRVKFKITGQMKDSS